MISEFDAAQKTCPASRTPEKGCIGQKCMAWRWAPPSEGKPMGRPPKEKKIFDRLGYCGLAGPIAT
jgi:hypothetical protein